MKLALFIVSFIISSITLASPEYMQGSPTAVQLAIQATYGSTAGANNNSCTLCHTTNSGGSQNFSEGTFGSDFIDAAQRLGINPASELPTLGPTNSLQAVFAESTFRNDDSDGDGVNNQQEFIDNTDPSRANGSSSGGGSGCGLVVPLQKDQFPPSSSLLFFLPLILLFYLRERSRSFIKK